MFTALLAQADAKGDLDWIVSVDSTIVWAHQHAAGAVKRGPYRRTGRPCPWPVPRWTPEVELVMSLGCLGGHDGQTGLGEAAVFEVAAVLDVA